MANEVALTHQDLRAMLEKRRAELAQSLPAHIKPERLIRSVALAAIANPDILNCAKETVMACAYRAAELGLDCSGGVMGQGYLIPFWNKKNNRKECQFIPGYRGLIDLARRTGEYKTFFAEVICENDEHDITFGTDPKIVHKPHLGEDRGEPLYYYAVAKTGDGDMQFAVMTLAQVEAIRQRSKSSDSGPWKTDFDEMGKKTVIRRLIKYLPLSSEKLIRALEFSDSDDVNSREDEIEVQVQSAPPVGRHSTRPQEPPVEREIVYDAGANETTNDNNDVFPKETA